jgi:hypothetical protein
LDTKISIKRFAEVNAKTEISVVDDANLNLENGADRVEIQAPIYLTASDLTLVQKIVLQVAHTSNNFTENIAILGGPIARFVMMPFIAKLRKNKGLRADQPIDDETARRLKEMASAA